MLFKRYGNPAELLSSYTIPGLLGFFRYILEQEREDNLWQLWLHKPTEHPENFEKFKQSTIKRQQRKQKSGRITEDQEQAAINKAEDILKRVKAPNPGG